MGKDYDNGGGDEIPPPTPNSLGIAILLEHCPPLEVAKIDRLAQGYLDGDFMFMDLDPAQFLTAVEELGLATNMKMHACNAHAIVRAQRSKRNTPIYAKDRKSAAASPRLTED